VAVTFTEAAAAELKERIGAQLLALGRVEDALRLEEAYVSTIHGFGLRVLTEFAFESGSSPQPRLLNEDEQNALIRLALARTGASEAITENLEAYGYKFDWLSKKSRRTCSGTTCSRSSACCARWAGRRTAADYAAQAAEWIAARYGPTDDGARLSVALRASVEALLRDFPQSHAGLFPRQQRCDRGAAEGLPQPVPRGRAWRARADWGCGRRSGPADHRSAARTCPRATTTARQR
jgi:ATP-dependent helicase/nuclease subunit A